MANRWVRRATAAAGAVGLALVFGGGTSWAATSSKALALTDVPTVTWQGNGAHDGICENIGPSDDLNPPLGKQGWLFILTSPSGSSWTLTVTFNPPNTPVDVVGVKKGGGSIHFAVYADLGAKLVSASATNGTDKSVLTVSHCESGGTPGTPPPPPVTPHSSITSTVHNADHTVVDDSSKPATAPASVHDTVTVTVTDLKFWSGTITVRFFHNNDCKGDQSASATKDIDQDTSMPVEDLLPESGLAAGEYSYRESFVDTNNDALNVTGACEPFKVVEAPTPTPTTPTTTLATTGAPVGSIALAGTILLAGGVGLVAFVLVARRRRSQADSTTQL
jgi:uncharacterized protein (DUF2141 family)